MIACNSSNNPVRWRPLPSSSYRGKNRSREVASPIQGHREPECENVCGTLKLVLLTTVTYYFLRFVTTSGLLLEIDKLYKSIYLCLILSRRSINVSKWLQKVQGLKLTLCEWIQMGKPTLTMPLWGWTLARSWSMMSFIEVQSALALTCEGWFVLQFNWGSRLPEGLGLTDQRRLDIPRNGVKDLMQTSRSLDCWGWTSGQDWS